MPSNLNPNEKPFPLCIIVGKPKIEEGPRKISVISGANISFYCRYLGYPKPIVKWLKNGEVVDGSGRIKVFPPGELHIYKTTVRDSGEYTCLVSNKYGQDKSSAYLVVDGFGKL